ncbi:MAG TPA: hypothetical protein VE935_13215 [Burkholderiales bacterium]|jgi:hypothetical protein|nr:hypothetical protein [Burkholderiales bacterium]
MRLFIKNFAREGRGVWLCTRACDYDSPVGTIHVVPGTTVMRGVRVGSFDLAAALDEEYERRERFEPSWHA